MQFMYKLYVILYIYGFSVGSFDKESTCNAGNPD